MYEKKKSNFRFKIFEQGATSFINNKVFTRKNLTVNNVTHVTSEEYKFLEISRKKFTVRYLIKRNETIVILGGNTAPAHLLIKKSPKKKIKRIKAIK